MQATEFRAVPFNPNWINHDKIDIHAIYRRPILSEENGEQLVDEHGVLRWDLTGGLPVRRHNDWIKKGFQYVTLAGAKDLFDKHVVAGLRAQGLNPADYILIRNRTVGASPWNPQLYLRSQTSHARDHATKLEALVQQLGSAAVLAVKQIDDLHFQLPAYLRNVPAGGPIVRPNGACAPVVAGKRVKLGPEVGDERAIDDESGIPAAPETTPAASDQADSSGVVMGRVFSKGPRG